MSTARSADASIDKDDDSFHKTVEFEKTDDEEQIAYGAVLVPNRVDHEGDFVREELIKQFSDGFAERFAESDALPGVMHAVFPEEHIELAESRVLDEPEQLGEKTLPAGSWVQGYKYTDDRAWQLVKDGVLSGFSIGGTLDSRVMYEPGAHPDDVTFPEPVKDELADADLEPGDVPIWEIKDGGIMEVSTVDKPAFPDATHEEYKSLTKANPALTDNVVAARRALEARGHSEEDAKRLAEYMNDVKAVDEDERGWFARAKAFITPGDDSPSNSHGGKGTSTGSTEKDGRTLSRENVRSAKAAHDAALDLLSRSDVEHGRVRFSDDAGDGFDIADYAASDKAADSGSFEDTDMSESEFSKRLDSIEEKVDAIADGGEGGDADEKDAEEGGDDEPSLEEKVEQLAENVEGLASNQEKMGDALTQIADAQGTSQQADTGQKTTEKTWDNSPFGLGGDN